MDFIAPAKRGEVTTPALPVVYIGYILHQGEWAHAATLKLSQSAGQKHPITMNDVV